MSNIEEPKVYKYIAVMNNILEALKNFFDGMLCRHVSYRVRTYSKAYNRGFITGAVKKLEALLPDE